MYSCMLGNVDYGPGRVDSVHSFVGAVASGRGIKGRPLGCAGGQSKKSQKGYSKDQRLQFNQRRGIYVWMVYSLVVRARGLEYGGREFKSRSLHLKPETELREERGLSGCRKGLKTVPLAQALLSLKPSKLKNKSDFSQMSMNYMRCKFA